MQLNVVPLSGLDLSHLPKEWDRISKNEDTHDLAVLAQRFAAHGERNGDLPERIKVLGFIGQSFQSPFDVATYRGMIEGAHIELKNKVLTALETLAKELRGHVPTLVWDVLATIAIRPDPTETRSLVHEANRFPMGIVAADAVMHGLSETKALDGHIQTKLAEIAGVVYMHCKDCNCAYRELEEDESYRLPLKPGSLKTQAQALLSNMLGATVRLGHGIPWEFTLTPQNA